MTTENKKENTVSEKQIIEINGVKMEIDTRYAKRIDTLCVGSRVKLLFKEKTYAGNVDTKVHSGVVVGFEPFQDLPTIIVCYLEVNYSEATLKFAYVNASTSEKYDLVASVDEELPIQKSDVLARMDREIAKRAEEIADIERKRDYFLRYFNSYFERESA